MNRVDKSHLSTQVLLKQDLANESGMVHYHSRSIQIAKFWIWEIQALCQELEIYKYISG